MVLGIHGDSNVGKPSLYESGDQSNLPRDQRAHAEGVSKSLETNSKCSRVTCAELGTDKMTGRDNIMGYSSLMDSNHTHKVGINCRWSDEELRS